jgi:hypothetical protein
MPSSPIGSARPPLTAKEYERIYQVIYSVLDGRANTPHACLFFATAGSLILNKYHSVPSRPVAGAFFLRPGTSDDVLSFATQQDGAFSSDADGFHCWVQTRAYLIDFMAPIFEESFRAKGQSISVPRRMFQRMLTEEAMSLETLSQGGGFFTLPNPALTERLVDSAINKVTHTDLLNAVDSWYEKLPTPLKDLALMSDDGKLVRLKLSAPPISGQW